MDETNVIYVFSFDRKINYLPNFVTLLLVSDIQCSFATPTSSTQDMITARLKKPNGFKGAPLFADDRSVNPETDRTCSIRPEVNDPDSLAYTLKITDFTRCGVLKRNVRKSIHCYFGYLI